jgi:DNA-directed RNA polymerase specialized sigma24 family protein
VDLVRRESRHKRGGNLGREAALDNLLAREQSPDVAAQFTDELNWLLNRLTAAGDPDLRIIALARLEGERPAEIAAWLGCARRTVERKLAMIARLCDAGEIA